MNICVSYQHIGKSSKLPIELKIRVADDLVSVC